MIDQLEQNDVLGDFAKRLEKIGIDYMLTGSMALVHYAMPRATVDIDIVVRISPEDLDRFISEFESDYYISISKCQDCGPGRKDVQHLESAGGFEDRLCYPQRQ